MYAGRDPSRGLPSPFAIGFSAAADRDTVVIDAIGGDEDAGHAVACEAMGR